MWSEPFFVQKADKKLAVLLMDTQGIFDHYLGIREWVVIVGLSLLTSSVFVFNLFNDIKEDNLQILEMYMTYGLTQLVEILMLPAAVALSETGLLDSGFPTLWRISFRKRWRQKIFRKEARSSSKPKGSFYSNTETCETRLCRHPVLSAALSSPRLSQPELEQITGYRYRICKKDGHICN